MEQNRQAYEEKRVTHTYFSKPKLMGAEKIFLEAKGSALKTSHMLDVGVGGGRTTYFFAPLVASYTGIDYSEAMMEHCQDKYGHLRNTSFFLKDARNLSSFKPQTFDLIQFSFNGIDCVGYTDRLKVLQEFNRVLKSRGDLVFSFHNAHHIKKLYSFQMPRNPFKINQEKRRLQKLQELNGPQEQFEKSEFFLLYDGAEFFNLLVLYITPEKQKKDLEAMGFQVVGWYDLQSGKKIEEEQLQLTNASWIFVHAQKS